MNETEREILGATVALAELPAMTPAKLRYLISGGGAPQAWARVLAGKAFDISDRKSNPNDHSERSEAQPSALPPEWHAVAEATRLSKWSALAKSWAEAALEVEPRSRIDLYRSRGIGVMVPGLGAYPKRLLEEPVLPPVLFTSGRCVLTRDVPTVGLVGTRNCTAYGRQVAQSLGKELAGKGIAVVSGLALGIDAAGHRGALDAGGTPPVGVVASGLDVIYPPSNQAIWQEVSRMGILLSETPLGGSAQAWRFPWRNRIIAALSDVVVVVESHRIGGSLLTVEAAERRGVPVMAVPGSIRSPASYGTNELIAQGCAPCRDADDVLAMLALARCHLETQSVSHARPDRRPTLTFGKPSTNLENECHSKASS